ncbi:FAAL and PKS domain-containing protein [Ktedonobacteria bacterium brp13]|nr:FAAL and PKS domain-containing protein [Ktedonobacteria bacterium brp13]
MKTRISASARDFATLVDLLRWRNDQQPEQRIYSFLTDGEKEKGALTFAELDRQARIIGASLQERLPRGERALLIYPSGLEFITAFFGCLYSGIIAVPVYPPSTVRSDRTLTKFRAIVQNAGVKAVLTSTAMSTKVTSLIEQTPELQSAFYAVTDELPTELGDHWHSPDIQQDTLAFLQYTSGSTGTPKGVMVTHGNLLHNASVVERYCEHPLEGAHSVMWLPLYHDLGLIGGVLQPLYAGYESTIMAPTTFLQRPYRWLQAVSNRKATISGGPNFAFDLAARKVTEEQKASLDLSHWEIVANGAEPVRPDTLQRFADAFASCGFRPNYFYPCYGLAEATLVVSAGKKGIAPSIHPFDGAALEQNIAQVADTNEANARTLVSIGQSQPDQTVIIVDPSSFTQCPADRVGEIWVAGPSVAKGYWQRPVETKETFQAYLSPDDEGPFLRTGDMGFSHESELYITGRLKDLIIIRGSNHYPQDIERTIESSHKAVRANGSAAFSVDIAGEERLIVVQEVERTALSSNLAKVVATMREAIAAQHEIQVYGIVLIKPGSLPKTSSGKVQRRGTKAAYLEYLQGKPSLDIVHSWHLEQPAMVKNPLLPGTQSDFSTQENMTQPSQQHSAVEIQAWLTQHIAQLLKVRAESIDVHESFAFYGMDSAQAIALSAELEDLIERDLPPTLAYDYPTIAALSSYLAGEKQPEIKSEQTNEQHNSSKEPIAVVGLGCRFPGAESPEAFWKLLSEGVDGISEVPAQRWNVDQYYAQEAATPGKVNTRFGGFLSQVDQFDPAFFGIAPREANGMDPQQRLLLEVAWETFEHAGIVPERAVGSQTGVFVGISSDEYSRLAFEKPEHIDAYAGTGNAYSIAANRLSYVFDLHGPSMALDTACSSSLLAIHQACQSLRSGECEQALAGGVNIILSPDLTIAFSQARMMAADGHCKTFDEAADGYVRGEGCGLVLLKTLSAAERDGDTVFAVIRGSAVNQDGRSNGLTAPNGHAQEAVIRQALRNADVSPAQVSYVETHGTGTALGDPIEVNALKAVLMQGSEEQFPVVLGAVKTNIGHLESAAGIAGFIKTVLSLHKGEILPNRNFKRLNTHISFDGTTFTIPTRRQPWPAQQRIAGVSAFGFGGTNVHLIVEAAQTQPPVVNEVARTEHVLALSARSPEALKHAAQNYSEFLAANPAVSFAAIAASANTGRTHFNTRLALSAANSQQAREQLDSFAHGDSVIEGLQHGQKNNGKRKVAFLFSGQGTQYVGMARQLYETEPTFRAALDRCDRILHAYLDQPLLTVLYKLATADSPLQETRYTQPALFSLEYALAELWRSWGIQPDIVLGHSIGEYVAACSAGMFSLEDGLKLITARGRLMQELPEHGSMVVAFASPAQLADIIEPHKDRVSIAVINGPRNTVLSGDSQRIQLIVSQLEKAGIDTHPMAVSHAFHSPLIEPMLASYERIAGDITYTPSQIPLVSNVTGEVLEVGTIVDAHYWGTQTRTAVQFNASMQTLAAQGYNTFVEIGPHATLMNMGKRCLPVGSGNWIPSLHREQDNWYTLTQAVATLYTLGVEIDWHGFEQAYQHQRVDLPTYPFERQTYWFQEQRTSTEVPPRQQPVAAEPISAVSTPDSQRHPLLTTHMALVHPVRMHVWESSLDTHHLPYLKDHRIHGAIALPISAYVEMAQAATREVFGVGQHILQEIELKKLLLLPEKGTQKIQVVLSSDTNNQTAFQIYSHTVGAPDQPPEQWILHAAGKIQQQ